MTKNVGKIATLLLAIVLCVSCLSICMSASSSGLAAENASVTLDGTNDGEVTVSVIATADISIYAIQGTWSVTESEGTGYLTMTDIGSDSFVFQGMNDADPETGYLIWADDTFASPAVFATGGKMITATYKVAADTPAGTYTVLFNTEAILDGNWTEIYDDFTATIEVVRESTPSCEHTPTKLVPNGDGTHNEVCADDTCGFVVAEKVTCTVDESKTTYDVAENATCCEAGDQWKYLYCACGAKLDSVLIEGTIPATGEHTLVKYEKEAATCTTPGHKAYWMCDKLGFSFTDADGKNKIEDIHAWLSEGGDGYISVDSNNHTSSEVIYTDNGETHSAIYACCHAEYRPDEPHDYKNNYECVCGAKYTGWDTEIDGEDDVTVHTFYVINGVRQFSGWTKIDGYWYYLSTTSGYRAEGFSRVPYNTELGHAPNADDLAYYNANKDTSKYTDAESAVYYFGRDGKLQHVTDIVVDGDTERYAVDGVVAWHVGLVEVYGEYYYFVGDVNGGGNKAAEGDVWVTRTNRIAALEEGSCYNFKDGQLSGLSGISNGKYYENSKLMRGKGLTKVGEKYIYVRSTGQLATVQYYIPAGSELASGMYQIDEDGFIIDPKPSDVDGIVDGYYYEKGKLVYAGLIEIDGDIYYVNSSGKVVTGTYYVTKTNGLAGYEVGDKLVFGEDGKMETVKNGIVEENGALYYYEKNHVQYGAGVVELTDAEGETFYIYVKSDGTLATGEYWPTTTNGELERGCYDWGTDGRYYPAN